MASQLAPTTFEAAAAALAGAAESGEAVRIVGAGTKLSWGAVGALADLELHTTGLDRIVEHNAGDLTAVLQAGVPLAAAQERFAASGQMLALDPFLGRLPGATIGGVIATGDSGPLRHRYGAPRDLVLGMTVALSDGTIARSGGKVIKNVAGYDVAKLFCGSFGTLGLVLEVNVRLHPLPAASATALGVSSDPDQLAAVARALAAAPLELEALDIAWRAGRGGILAQCGGALAPARAQRVARLMRDADLDQVQVAGDDGELWARQRAGQRSRGVALVRVASRPSAMAAVLRAADACRATVVGRAASGHSYLEVDPQALDRVGELLPPGAVAVLLDVPAEIRGGRDPWSPFAMRPTPQLMRDVKARFDPARACNPGVFVGGI